MVTFCLSKVILLEESRPSGLKDRHVLGWKSKVPVRASPIGRILADPPTIYQPS